jgi:hypothetical protein
MEDKTVEQNKDNMMNKGNESHYENCEIDLQALAQYIAEEQWNDDTKGVPETEIYEVVEGVPRIRDSYGQLYWSLEAKWREIISTFIKPE